MKSFLYRKQIGYISLIISVLSVYVFRNVLGDTGLGYFAPVYLVVVMIWELFGDGSSDVISRLVRVKLSKGQKNSALNILSTSGFLLFIYAVVGAVLTGVLNFYLMDRAFGLSKGRFLGFYLCIFIFFRIINEYLTGYDLAASGDKAVCIAIVLRQLLRILSGYPFMMIMYEKGEKISALLMDEEYKYIYSVSGVFLGFCLAEFFVFVFLKGYESYSSGDSPSYVFVSLWKRRLGNIVVGLSFTGFLFSWLFSAEGAVSVGEAFGIMMVPFLISAAVTLYETSASSIHWLGAVRKKEKGNSRAYFDCGIHIAIIASVFIASFYSGASKSIMKVMLPDAATNLTAELVLSVVASVMYSLTLFSDNICAARDDKIPRIVSGFVSALMGILSVRLCIGTGMNIYRSLSVSLIVFSLVGTVVWYVITFFRMNMVYDPLRNILIPVISGAVNAIVVLIITNFASAHLGNLFTVLICIPISLIVYNSILLLLRNYTDTEIGLMPFGNMLISLGQILRVM